VTAENNICSRINPCPQTEKQKEGWHHKDIVEYEKLDNETCIYICLNCGHTFTDKKKSFETKEWQGECIGEGKSIPERVLPKQKERAPRKRKRR
jgi:uncharacterized UBP type Zn finger protein